MAEVAVAEDTAGMMTGIAVVTMAGMILAGIATAEEALLLGARIRSEVAAFDGVGSPTLID